MNKLRLVAVAAMMSAVSMFSAGTAQAQNYVEVDVVLNPVDSPVVGGQTVNFHATTAANHDNVDCAWTVTWSDGVAAGEDPVRTGNGFSFSGSFKSKVVGSSTPTTMTAECVYDDGIAAPSSASASSGNTVSPAIYSGMSPTLQGGLQTAPHDANPASVTVVLLPVGDSGGDDGDSGGHDRELPDTGGSNLSWLLIGGTLVLVGAGVTFAARRRHTAR